MGKMTEPSEQEPTSGKMGGGGARNDPTLIFTWVPRREEARVSQLSFRVLLAFHRFLSQFRIKVCASSALESAG